MTKVLNGRGEYKLRRTEQLPQLQSQFLPPMHRPTVDDP